jgi:hypothetical protein
MMVSHSLVFTSSGTKRFSSNQKLHHAYLYQIGRRAVKKNLLIGTNQPRRTCKRGLYRMSSVQAPD